MPPVVIIDNMLNQLNDEDLNKVVSYITFLTNHHDQSQPISPSLRIGVAQDIDLYSPGFDLIHGADDDVAELFGVLQ